MLRSAVPSKGRPREERRVGETVERARRSRRTRGCRRSRDGSCRPNRTRRRCWPICDRCRDPARAVSLPRPRAKSRRRHPSSASASATSRIRHRARTASRPAIGSRNLQPSLPAGARPANGLIYDDGNDAEPAPVHPLGLCQAARRRRHGVAHAERNHVGELNGGLGGGLGDCTELRVPLGRVIDRRAIAQPDRRSRHWRRR